MEKIISINFQGRVIPIEETAYNNLKKYIDSLRSHFANEEGSDEIINDIENRIAELLNDRLKHGAPCIVSKDVTAVIDSIGRLEDIEAAESEEQKEAPRSRQPYPNAPVARGRFVRNEDDKVIAGVCSGIANRMGIDPVIVRILFVLLFGALFWVYIILWIIVPSQSVQTSVTRRLYRNPDDKKIGGVCGGLAAYFNVSSTTIRLVFLLPLIISIISGGLHSIFWHMPWGFGPRIVFGSLGSTMFIAYIVLWIAVPYAKSAADKLEMRGEKVDMNSIKAATQARAGAAEPVRRSNGFGRIIAILFKAFFLFIASIIAISLFAVLIALVFGGIAAMPYTDFFLDGRTQHSLAWAGVVLLLGIPLLGMITWGVRRFAGARSPRRNYLGYIFTILWVTGLVITINTVASVARDFSSSDTQEEVYPLAQPAGNKIYINVSNSEPGGTHYYSKWYNEWNDNDGFRILSNDSLWLNDVRVKIAQSPDSLFHIYKIRISRGKTAEQARELAGNINFNLTQYDSTITLPKGFTISKKDKFRNQHVRVVVEVPVGKTIQLDKNIKRYEWLDIHVSSRHHGRYYSRHRRSRMHYWKNKEYVMTPDGLKNVEDSAIEENEDRSWDDEN